MSQEKLKFAVSSISCAESDPWLAPQIVIPRFATSKMVSNAARLRDALAPVIEREHFSVSLHPASVVDPLKAARLLKKSDIPISSIDCPDIIPRSQLIKSIVGSIFHRDLARVKNHIGWWLQNVGSRSAYERGIKEGLSAMSATITPHIVRTDASAWLDSTRGSKLRTKLKDYPDTILAVEMDASKQNPTEYLELLQRLAMTNGRDVPVYGDIDIGHLGESQERQRHRAEVMPPLQVYEMILRDRALSRLVAVTSLNQYIPGDQETHTNLMNGPIDLVKVGGLLGRAARDGVLPFAPMVVAEFHPQEYRLFASPEGLAFVKKLTESFNAA